MRTGYPPPRLGSLQHLWVQGPVLAALQPSNSSHRPETRLGEVLCPAKGHRAVRGRAGIFAFRSCPQARAWPGLPQPWEGRRGSPSPAGRQSGALTAARPTSKGLSGALSGAPCVRGGEPAWVGREVAGRPGWALGWGARGLNRRARNEAAPGHLVREPERVQKGPGGRGGGHGGKQNDRHRMRQRAAHRDRKRASD